MSMLSYPVKFTTGKDGRVLVEFIDLPRVATDGKDEREAMEEAIDALSSDLSVGLSRRDGIPTPSPVKRGQRQVDSAALVGTEAGSLSRHAQAGRQQLRVGPPPGRQRARHPPHARPAARH